MKTSRIDWSNEEIQILMKIYDNKNISIKNIAIKAMDFLGRRKIHDVILKIYQLLNNKNIKHKKSKQ